MKTKNQKGVNNMIKINDESSLEQQYLKKEKQDELEKRKKWWEGIKSLNLTKYYSQKEPRTLLYKRHKEDSKEVETLYNLHRYLIKIHDNKIQLLNEIRREIFHNRISEEELSTLKTPLSKRYKEISEELHMLYGYIRCVSKVYKFKVKLFNKFNSLNYNELRNDYLSTFTKKGETK